jgi:phosphatidylserine/phosphatidylglycerophosphate/cardiolipin synthase-like enzyme
LLGLSSFDTLLNVRSVLTLFYGCHFDIFKDERSFAMRYLIGACFFSLAGLFIGAEPAPQSTEIATHAHFSPFGGCTAAIVDQIDSAKSSIHVASYVFTSKTIADALIQAKKRGVQVAIVIDSHGKNCIGSVVPFMETNGIEIYEDDRHEIFHNKFIIIDSIRLVLGSFNYTGQAESRNAENILELSDESVTKTYDENWLSHKIHSKAVKSSLPKEEATAFKSSASANIVCPNNQCPATTPNRQKRR